MGGPHGVQYHHRLSTLARDTFAMVNITTIASKQAYDVEPGKVEDGSANSVNAAEAKVDELRQRIRDNEPSHVE